jgi:selenide,water dikinase
VLRELPTIKDSNVLVGTATADDAGVYRLSDDLAVVQTLDFFPPVVDDPYVYGQIAAANALSDVYAMGGTPKTALNLVGFPDDELPLEILARILQGGAERCREAGCVVIGGHTVRDREIKYGLSVLGVVHPSQVITNAGARPGDVLVLTKPLGTGFVTTAHRAGKCPEATLQAAISSMIQLNREAAEAAKAARAHAMTDITGFGLAGHAYEMAEASGCTFRIYLERLPLLPGVEELVERKFFTRASRTNRAFVEPGLRIEGRPDRIRMEIFYDAQTSGGLLIAVAEENLSELETRLREGGCLAARVGEALPATDSFRLVVC